MSHYHQQGVQSWPTASCQPGPIITMPLCTGLPRPPVPPPTWHPSTSTTTAKPLITQSGATVVTVKHVTHVALPASAHKAPAAVSVVHASPPRASTGLAYTGSETGALLILAIGLIAGGAAAMAVAHRVFFGRRGKRH
jgi:hypothetical protein